MKLYSNSDGLPCKQGTGYTMQEIKAWEDTASGNGGVYTAILKVATAQWCAGAPPRAPTSAFTELHFADLQLNEDKQNGTNKHFFLNILIYQQPCAMTVSFRVYCARVIRYPTVVPPTDARAPCHWPPPAAAVRRRSPPLRSRVGCAFSRTGARNRSDPSPSPSASGKRAASVLSDDGSSGSDSTIRAPEAEDQDHFKVVRSKKCLRKGPIGLIDIINRFRNSTNFRPIHLIKWIRCITGPRPVQDKDRNLTRLLINGKIPFHTHPLDEERKIKAVIKGITVEPPIKEDQDSATGAKTTGMQLLTAMLNPDVLKTPGLEISPEGRSGLTNSTCPKPSGRLQLTINLILGDIKSVMAILRLVKSEGFAELASDFRRARMGRPLSGHSQPSRYLVSTRVTIMSEAPGALIIVQLDA
ncbi:hypothetical protein EVAR_53072_1 [Eumeta japonica]|uniref:Uncharacterized protein n=1 Tax=Eumeta variegata TaxID=151549 RepID=A0A4C1YSF8_EUMVA|nr:hypothetical protein EVAR_53072_1 [Eumeta japonica]